MDYNLKIQVNHENESLDAQALFFALGGSWCVGGTAFSHLDQPYLYLSSGEVMCGSDAKHFRCDDGAEITLEALRDLVHAKKNSENEKEMNILDEGRYVEKEYINKTTGEYRKTADVVSGEQWIEVPSGAKCLTKCVWLDGETYLIWWKEGFKKCIGGDNDWVKVNHSVLDYLEDGRPSVLWQRLAQPEALSFVDDEPSLNDKYAEIEKMCQAIKVKSGSDSDHGVDAMAYGCIGLVEPRENNHYFINVSDVDEVDFYEIAKRYNVADPAIQHILKKCLAIGNRGHKDLETDLNDILKTAKRALTINGFKVKGESK